MVKDKSAHKFPTDDEDLGDNDESGTINTDMALAKAIDFMNSTKDIEIKTDINQNAIPFVVALALEEKYTDSKVMGKFIKDFKILRVSKDRKSRLEIIELAKTRRQEEQGNSGMWARTVNWLRSGKGGMQ